jgi:hypothetical protein
MTTCSAPTRSDHAHSMGRVVATPPSVIVATSITCMTVTSITRTKVMSTST